MSLVHLAWAFARETGSPTKKAVLVSLANHCNKHTLRCDPLISTLVEETEYSESTVRKALADLVTDGIIERERKRNQDGSLGGYRYVFPEVEVSERESHRRETAVGDPANSEDPYRRETAVKNLNTTEERPNREETTRLSERDSLARDDRGPRSVDRKPTTAGERHFARAALDLWNELAGTRYRSDDVLGKIIMRHREYPEASLADHRLIIEAALRERWWKGAASPSVVYGNAAQFERSIHAVDLAVADSTRIERIVAEVQRRQGGSR